MITGDALMQAAEYARPMLLRMANGRDEIVDEVIGHTIMKLWETRANFRGDCSVSTLFYQASRRNFLWMFARSKWKHEPETYLEQFRDRRQNPEQRLLAKERRHVLIDAVLSLPPMERREALNLADGNRTYEDGTRKSRKLRARRRLKTILLQHPIFQHRKAA